MKFYANGWRFKIVNILLWTEPNLTILTRVYVISIKLEVFSGDLDCNYFEQKIQHSLLWKLIEENLQYKCNKIIYYLRITLLSCNCFGKLFSFFHIAK